jgi:glucokinase
MSLSNREKSFSPVSDTDIQVFENLKKKVQHVFPKHLIIKDDRLLQTKVDIFEADGENPPSIQHLLFSTIET